MDGSDHWVSLDVPAAGIGAMLRPVPPLRAAAAGPVAKLRMWLLHWLVWDRRGVFPRVHRLWVGLRRVTALDLGRSEFCLLSSVLSL